MCKKKKEKQRRKQQFNISYSREWGGMRLGVHSWGMSATLCMRMKTLSRKTCDGLHAQWSEQPLGIHTQANTKLAMARTLQLPL